MTYFLRNFKKTEEELAAAFYKTAGRLLKEVS